MTDEPSHPGFFAVRRPLSNYVALLVLSVLLPMAAVTAGLLWRLSALDQARSNEQALSMARSVSENIDRDISASVESLNALASSPLLAQGNFADFYRQATDVMSLRKQHILLRGLDGRQLLNTRVPWGSAFPAQDLSETDKKALAELKPAVSNLRVGTISGHWVIGLTVPVIIDDAVRYLLTMSIDPGYIRDIISTSARNPSWITAISDRNGRIIARSAEHELYVGRQIHPDVKMWSAGAEGVHRTDTLAGQQVVRGYHWAADSGWLAAAFAPTSVIDGPRIATWWIFVLAAIAITTAAVPFVYWTSRQITEPIRAAADKARRLGEGEIIPVSSSNVQEADDLFHSLAAASQSALKRLQDLHRSETAYRSVFDQSIVGFKHVDLEGRLIGVNETLCRMLGYTREECLSKSFKLLTHPLDIEAEEKNIADLFNGKVQSYEIEKRLISKSNEPIWVRVTSTLVRDDSGNPIYRTSTVEDIDGQRRARETAARLAAIVEASPDAMISVTPRGVVETWNNGARNLFGYQADEIIGQSVSVLLPEDRKQEFKDNLSALIRGEEVNEETIRRHKDGTPIDVTMTAVPIRADGGPVSISITMTDIRERKRREVQVMLLNRELAHRVKNTLAVIQSIANQTIRTSPEPDRFRDAFQGRLQALAAANDLLLRSNWGGTDIQDLIDKQLAPLIPRSGMELHKTGTALHVPADLSIPLGLALHELGTNAVKHGAWSVPGGQVQLSWTIEVREPDPKRYLILTWTEKNGPRVATPSRKGFGTTLIDRGVPGATVERDYRPEGLVCRIRLPLDVGNGENSG